MPYAQSHYPFENKKQFEGTFPADFIAEGVDQTRGWYVTLFVHLSVCLFVYVYMYSTVYYHKRQKLSEKKVLRFTGFHPNARKAFAVLLH